MSAALIFAFTAGAVSTVNPCGFALLPVFFARQFAGRDGENGIVTLLRAARSGTAAAVGFVVVFAVAGLAVSSGSLWVGAALPYFGVAIGGLLLVAGLILLAGLTLPDMAGLNACRRISDRHGALGFGLSYGLVSLSCSLPVFMAVLGTSLLGVGRINLVNLGAFLLGAASVLVVVAVAAAVSGTGLKIVGRLPVAAVRRVSGAMVTAAGAYVFLYWGREFFTIPAWSRRILDEGSYFSSNLNILLSEGSGIAVSAIGILLILAALWIAIRRAASTR